MGDCFGGRQLGRRHHLVGDLVGDGLVGDSLGERQLRGRQFRGRQFGRR